MSSKYRSKKVNTPDGIFDSQKEYKRYLELKAMQDRGEIHNLDRQVEFELIPKQYINGKFAEYACKYKADFVYTYDGSQVVEDVKSAYTRKLPEYVIKRKLMLYRHGLRINEVL